MKNIIESLIEQKYGRLLNWRYSTQRNDYPIKLAKNLLYDALTLIEMWSDLNKSFRTFNLSGSKKLYDNFSEAHKYIFVRRRQIQTEDILPFLDQKYLSVDNLPYLKFDAFRTRCQNACEGSSSEIEEVEFTYFFHTASYELIYAWSAAGLMGQGKDEAFKNVCATKWDNIDFNSLDSLVEAFGRTASIFYKPLPNF